MCLACFGSYRSRATPALSGAVLPMGARIDVINGHVNLAQITSASVECDLGAPSAIPTPSLPNETLICIFALNLGGLAL